MARIMLQILSWPMDGEAADWLISMVVWTVLFLISVWAIAWSLGGRRVLAFFTPGTRFSRSSGPLGHIAVGLLFLLVAVIVAAESVGAVRIMWYWLGRSLRLGE